MKPPLSMFQLFGLKFLPEALFLVLIASPLTDKPKECPPKYSIPQIQIHYMLLGQTMLYYWVEGPTVRGGDCSSFTAELFPKP